MPDYSTILKFTSAEDRSPLSYVMRLHERHVKGDEYLPMYTTKYAGNSSSLLTFSYYSQVMQAYALEMAIRTLRLSKPYCMGSLYWQLNDVWPVSSWATVDYYGIYKAAHYRIRQLHNLLLIHVLHSESSYKVYMVNDHIQSISLYVEIKIMDFNGSVYRNFSLERTAQGFENAFLMSFN